MTTNRILILGGYGSTGRPLARLLLAATDVDLILAGQEFGVGVDEGDVDAPRREITPALAH